MNNYFSTTLKGIVALTDSFHADNNLLADKTLYKFIWVKRGYIKIELDYVETIISENEIISVTNLQRLSIIEVEGEYITFLFNSNFYCIYGHDNEVSCNGLLFHGSSNLIKFTLEDSEIYELNEIIGVLSREFDNKDSLHEEMLRILLKRFIINCTRIARNRYQIDSIPHSSFEIVRQFYVLVDNNFRELKQVKDYAKLLNRSPKTLSNIFSTAKLQTPLAIIQDRIESEAKRLLLETSKPAKEIAYLLGFEDIAMFSRFFKNKTGLSISEFRAENKHY